MALEEWARINEEHRSKDMKEFDRRNGGHNMQKELLEDGWTERKDFYFQKRRLWNVIDR